MCMIKIRVMYLESIVHQTSGTKHRPTDLSWSRLASKWTVKLARAKLAANAGNFTCSSQVKRPHTQFTCIICSLPVNIGKFTCFNAASSSHKIHAICPQSHVNLPDYNEHFTGKFACGTYANLPATSMQNCLLLQAKYMQFTGKIARIAGKKTAKACKNTRTIADKNKCKRMQKYPHNRKQKHAQLQLKIPDIVGDLQSHRG